MKVQIKLLMLNVLLIAIGTALAGCNTVDGFGKDLTAGGNQLQKSAHQNS
jgi:predicted small secreted protein